VERLDEAHLGGCRVTSLVPGLRRVVLIGPECTGKTSLAAELATRFDVPWSAEYARQFVDEHPRPVEFADVDAIGRGQQQLEDDAIARATSLGARLVLHDTDLVSTAVYSRHYYDDCPAWIEPAAARRVADLYLLHDIDVPWTDEAFQRAEPTRREELFERFRLTLARLGATAVVVAGGWDARGRIADEAVARVIEGPRLEARG
jgi:NadR type nicotinamide-nucleotide adenylyltransferase